MNTENPYTAPEAPLVREGREPETRPRSELSPTFLGALIGACAGCLLALTHPGPQGLFWVDAVGVRMRSSGVTPLGALVFVAGGALIGGLVGFVVEVPRQGSVA